jgi:hypothetical protein
MSLFCPENDDSRFARAYNVRECETVHNNTSFILLANYILRRKGYGACSQANTHASSA